MHLLPVLLHCAVHICITSSYCVRGYTLLLLVTDFCILCPWLVEWSLAKMCWGIRHFSIYCKLFIGVPVDFWKVQWYKVELFFINSTCDLPFCLVPRPYPTPVLIPGKALEAKAREYIRLHAFPITISTVLQRNWYPWGFLFLTHLVCCNTICVWLAVFWEWVCGRGEHYPWSNRKYPVNIRFIAAVVAHVGEGLYARNLCRWEHICDKLAYTTHEL